MVSRGDRAGSCRKGTDGAASYNSTLLENRVKVLLPPFIEPNTRIVAPLRAPPTSNAARTENTS
jgi:hypothetical protein